MPANNVQLKLTKEIFFAILLFTVCYEEKLCK